LDLPFFHHYRRIIALIILLVVVVPLFVGLWQLWAAHCGRRDFARLLAGDQRVSITQVKIEGYGIQSIELQDTLVVDYLSEMLRSAKPGEGDLGTGYHMSIHLSTGSDVVCVLWVPGTKKDQITLFFPLNTLGDPDRYAVALSEPVPDELQRVLNRLRD
jgi:hypothetical protein